MKCEICGKELIQSLKPKCLWDVIDCFHRNEPCIPSCNECYNKAWNMKDELKSLDFRFIRQKILGDV